MEAKRVSGVVLAAGPSTRFDSELPKQLVEVDGEPLVVRAVHQALESKLCEVIVVLGHSAARIRATIGDLPLSMVENFAYAEGQSTSVRCGLAAVDSGSSAAMFIAVDQPKLTAPIIDVLIDAYLHSDGWIVLPTFQGSRGSPVLIDRRLFPELEVIVGDEGGRQIFARHEDRIVEVPQESAEPLRDVDRVEDLSRYRS